MFAGTNANYVGIPQPCVQPNGEQNLDYIFYGVLTDPTDIFGVTLEQAKAVVEKLARENAVNSYLATQSFFCSPSVTADKKKLVDAMVIVHSGFKLSMRTIAPKLGPIDLLVQRTPYMNPQKGVVDATAAGERTVTV